MKIFHPSFSKGEGEDLCKIVSYLLDFVILLSQFGLGLGLKGKVSG